MTRSNHPYDRAFFAGRATASERSARRIVPVVLSLVHVHSVIDIGCGDGSWLAEFARCGADDVVGVDGSYVPDDVLKIPATWFVRRDLKQPIAFDREFDLAVSLEVGEHLPGSRAATLVRDLTTLAPRVLFSAAIPFQRGTHHVNCQWPDYWQRLFLTHDYVAVDVLRSALWNDPQIEFWYRQNTILYVRRDLVEASAALRPWLAHADAPVKRLVHPELCETWNGYSLREVVGMLPSTVAKALGRRIVPRKASSRAAL